MITLSRMEKTVKVGEGAQMIVPIEAIACNHLGVFPTLKSTSKAF